MQKGILFDLDGTLWDSAPFVAEAWNECLKRISNIKRHITALSVSKLMGKPLEAIFEAIFPELSKEEQLELMYPCLDSEVRYLSSHPCSLYPESGNVLAALSKEYKLGIVSNCQDGYIDVYLRQCGFAELFSDVQYFDGIGKTKGENIRRVMERQGMERCIYVGDTQGDADAAKEAGIPFVHAAYGYGSVLEPDASANSFLSLLEILPEMLS